MDNVTKKLAELITATNYRDFPGLTVTNAKFAILDNVGAILGACCTDIGKLFLKTQSKAGNGSCTVLGEGTKVSMMEACFINASLCQVLDFDDTFEINSLAVSHPGPAVVPAALSAGENIACSGKDLIRSVILGYETSCRVAKAIEPRQDEFWGFANTQIIGAVTAAGVLFGLNERELINALGAAVACSPVPNTNMMWSLEKRPMSWVKDGVGFATSTGVMSALLAKYGIISSQNGLGEDNGYYLLCGSKKYKEEEIIKDFGKQFQLDMLSFKPYPTCRFMQSTLDSVSLLLTENNIKDVDIETIEVYLTPYLSKIFAVYEPDSMIDAQFSLPYAISMILENQAPSPLWYSHENLSNSEIINKGKKVKLIPDSGIERLRVEKSILSPKVIIITKKGMKYEKQEYCAKGHPQKRLTKMDFQEKFKNNVRSIIEEHRIKEIIEIIDNLEECSNISELMTLLYTKE